MTKSQAHKDFDSLYPKLAKAMSLYGVKAEAMAKSFPRLLKVIDAGWGEHDCFTYIDNLLFTDRPDRQGFSTEAVDELLLIKNIFEFTFPQLSVSKHDPFNKMHVEDVRKTINELSQMLKQRVGKENAVEAEVAHEAKAGEVRRHEVGTIAALTNAFKLMEKDPLVARKEHRMIGEWLVAEGVLTPDVLERMLNYQTKMATRHLIGALLISEKAITQIELNRALCLQRGIPLVDAASIEISAEAVQQVPMRIARMKSAMPITIFGRQLVVAVSNPFDLELQEYFSFLSGARVLLVFSTPEQIAMAQASYGQVTASKTKQSSPEIARQQSTNGKNGKNGSISIPTANPEERIESYGFVDDEDEVEVEETKQSTLDENDETVIGLVNKTINDAIRVGASDIHFEAFHRSRNAQIRFRKDGVMEAHSEHPIAYHSAIVSRIKIMADLDISEKRKAQDGKIAFGLGNKKLDLRVSTIPTSNALEVVTVRLLSSGKPLPLNRIGMHPSILDAFHEQIIKPYGLILVCGPTGSGKTTTLHSVLNELNTPERKIWTAEDPVEVVQKNISQVQVLPKIGWTFDKALRSFLRADPDIIMVGEIRDTETAKVAVEASMTGHLVLSTLHTNSAAEALARMLDLEVQAFNLADATHAILAQRLVRRICPDCGEHFEFDNEELETLVAEYFLSSTGKAPTKADRDRLLARWRAEFTTDGHLHGKRAMGCSACNHSGYRGRLGIHELLVLTPELRHMVRDSASTGELFKQAIKNGMKTLRQDGIEKAIQGLTDFKEVRMVCL